MANESRVYNPARVLAIVGVVPLQGFGEDTFISIEPMSDSMTSKSGVDGEVSRSIGTDGRHLVTITLMQTSPSNDVLSGLVQVDRLTCGGASFPFKLEDLCGRTLFFAGTAWVKRRPNITFGREVSEREWQIETGTPTINIIGGNG